MTDDKVAETIRLRVRILEYEAHAAMTRTGREFVREVGADIEKWTDAMCESAHANGYTVEREWLRGWLADAMDAARKAMPKSFLTEEPDGTSE